VCCRHDDEKVVFFSCFKAVQMMKVWTFGTGFQRLASNHLKLLQSKAVVVSVEEKPKLNSAGGNQRDELT